MAGYSSRSVELELVSLNVPVQVGDSFVSDPIPAVLDFLHQPSIRELPEFLRHIVLRIVQVVGDYCWREDFNGCAGYVLKRLQNEECATSHPARPLSYRHACPAVEPATLSRVGLVGRSAITDGDIPNKTKYVPDNVVNTRDQFADPSLMGPIEKRTPLQPQRARVRSRERGTRPMDYFDTTADKGRDTTAVQHTIDRDAVQREVGE